MEAYKRFEMVSSMEQCLKNIASKPTNTEVDIQMPDASSTLEDHVHLDSDIDRTLVANQITTNSVDDDGLFTQCQTQNEMVPGECSITFLYLNKFLMIFFI